jgi:hypothetical protein
MTAVEFLVNQLEENKFITESQIHIAKEMEKQQGYSEEEVIAFGEFIFKHSLLAHSKGVKNLFETFKNK